MKRTGLAAVLLALPGARGALAMDERKAFPPAEAGMTRHVLQLPAQDDESALKVEPVVGKTVPGIVRLPADRTVGGAFR